MRTQINVMPKPYIYGNIVNEGYHELQNIYFNNLYYRRLYNCFDNFIELISSIPEFAEKVDEFEKNFLDCYGDRYCKTPTGYRNSSQLLNKKDRKIYFQYSKHYYNLIKRDKKYHDFLDEYAFFKIFLNYLDIIANKANIMLTEAIHQLETDIPGLYKHLFGKNKDLTIVLRLLRYSGGDEELCTSPHYDKSGLTLHLDNNACASEGKLIIGPYSEQFDPHQLSLPKRYFREGKQHSSAILFPGACLKLVGLPLNPSPHAALPNTTGYSYSLIAFCLIPNIDATSIQTCIYDKRQCKNIFNEY